MTPLSKDAQTYLDNFESWDPEGPTMRGLWLRISLAERREIEEAICERMHAQNADTAERVMRDLPEKWRDRVIARFKDT